MLQLSPNSIVQRLDKDIVDATLDETLVLLHVEHGKYYDLNKTSSDIWEWLKEPCSIESLSEKVSEKYDCTRDECYPDIKTFLEELIKLQLLIVQTN